MHPSTKGVGSPDAVKVRRKLLRWYDRNRRDLPWRKTLDPYRIWISEIMLQQTRVQAVIPYYEKFLRHFPDVKTLVAADEQKLLACWSGLGYYSRARNLQKAAQAIVARHAGKFPGKLEEALALPGIGAYTAPAVLSIAYSVPLAVLDGNVARVISRLFAISADVRSTTGKKLLMERATVLLSLRRPGDFNQAMMELGATVCVPKQPRCDVCPLRGDCAALRMNQVGKYPPTRRKAAPIIRHFRAVLISDRKGRCWLVRRPATERRMSGFWELPTEEISSDGSAARNSGSVSKNGIVLGPLLGRVQHTITTNKLEVAVFRGTLRGAFPKAGKWVTFAAMRSLPVTTITRKALRLAHPDVWR